MKGKGTINFLYWDGCAGGECGGGRSLAVCHRHRRERHRFGTARSVRQVWGSGVSWGLRGSEHWAIASTWLRTLQKSSIWLVFWSLLRVGVTNLISPVCWIVLYWNFFFFCFPSAASFVLSICEWKSFKVGLVCDWMRRWLLWSCEFGRILSVII